MRRRVKVVHLVEDLEVGGQEKVIATIATGLNQEAFDVEVWCLTRGGAIAESLCNEGATVRVLGLSTYHRPASILTMALCLRKSRVDILHTHGSFAGTFGRLAAMLIGQRGVLTHVHTTDRSLRRRHILIERFLAASTHRVICISQAVRHYVENEIGVPHEKTCLIYNGVRRYPGRSEGNVTNRFPWGFKDDDCILASVGALVENKGHRVLLESFHTLVKSFPHLRLVLVGDGPLRSELEEIVSKSGLSDHVKFVGLQFDVHPILTQADLFVLPTRYREGLSLAILEAMQHGLPVVSTKIGGIPEAVQDNLTGLLVPPGDPMALKGAIATLASDRSLRQAMGEAGRRRYEERFTAEHMVSRIEALYSSIHHDG
jgi:L-malate glycosyltransferase